MPEPLNFPLFGNSLIMAITILIHVFLAFIAVGAITIALYAEIIGVRKNDPRYDRMGLEYMRFIGNLMKVGGVLGVAIVVLLVGLFPRFTALLYNVFFWPLLGEVLAFLFLMGFSILYIETWGRVKKRWHLAFGSVTFAAAVVSAFIINAAHAFMLTPGKYFAGERVWQAVFNPTTFPSFLHLIIPCVINAALFYFFWAYFKRRDPYYLMVGKFNAQIAAVLMPFQILAGLFFLYAVYLNNPPAFRNIISGIASPFFWWMAPLGGAGLLASLIYLKLGWERGAKFLLLGGVITLLAFPFGGYTRERARKPYLVYGNMLVTQEWVGKVKTKVDRGEKIITEKGCRACHRIFGKGGTLAPELKNIENKFTPKALADFLKKPPPPMPASRLSEEELEILIEYLYRAR